MFSNIVFLWVIVRIVVHLVVRVVVGVVNSWLRVKVDVKALLLTRFLDFFGRPSSCAVDLSNHCRCLVKFQNVTLKKLVCFFLGDGKKIFYVSSCEI